MKAAVTQRSVQVIDDDGDIRDGPASRRFAFAAASGARVSLIAFCSSMGVRTLP